MLAHCLMQHTGRKVSPVECRDCVCITILSVAFLLHIRYMRHSNLCLYIRFGRSTSVSLSCLDTRTNLTCLCSSTLEGAASEKCLVLITGRTSGSTSFAAGTRERQIKQQPNDFKTAAAAANSAAAVRTGGRNIRVHSCQW